MKIIEISFSKKMPYAPYLNLQPGFVATVDEFEDVLEAMKQLDDLATKYYNTHYAQLQEHKLPDNFNETHTSRMEGTTLVVEPKLSKEESMIQLINASTSLAELKSYDLLAKNNEPLKQAYDFKFKELTNK